MELTTECVLCDWGMSSLGKNSKMLNLFGLSKNKRKWFEGKIKEKRFYREPVGKKVKLWMTVPLM